MSEDIFKYKLGEELKCIVTGFKGVVVARVQYLNKCVRYGIQPTELDENGETREWTYFDEEQLEPVDEEEQEGIFEKLKNKVIDFAPSGGPHNNPPGR